MKVKNGEYVGVDEKFIKEEDKYVDPSVVISEEKQKKISKNIINGVGIYIAIIFVISILIFVGVISVMISMISSM